MFYRNRAVINPDPFTFSFSPVPQFARCFADEDPDAGGVGDPEADTTPVDDDTPDPNKQKLIREATQQRKRAQAAERERDEFKSLAITTEDRELFESLKAQQADAEQKKLEEQGQYDQVVQKLKESQATELAALGAREGKLKAIVAQKAVSDALKSALAAKGITKVDQAAKLLADRVGIEFADDYSGYAVNVLNGDGTVQLDPDADTAKSITIKSLVDEWAGDNPHFLPASGDTGSGAHNNGAGSSKPTQAQLDADPEAKVKFIAEHSLSEYMQLDKKKEAINGQ